MEIAYGDGDRVTRDQRPATISTGAIESRQDRHHLRRGLLLESGLIDVVIDATGNPGVGADFGLMAMEHGKHLVMMNVEADVTIGAYLQAARPTGSASSIRSAPATSPRPAWS